MLKILMKQYQLLIDKRERTLLRYLNYSKAFIEYKNDMDDNYKIIEQHNPNEKGKVLIVFDVMIADIVIKTLIQQ